MNFISIKPMKGDGDGVIFRVADDRHVSRLLWIFMIENIRSGFIVTLQTAGGELSQASGGKVGIEEYRRHMAGASLENALAHMALHETRGKGG
jgi:hypothetical protein